MKNKLQPTRTSFSRNFQCKKAPHWLSKFFSFWYWKSGGPVKKTTLYIVYYIVYSSKHLHKKMYTRWQPGTFKIKVVKDWSLSTSPCNIFLNNWRHLFKKEERTWSKFGSLFSPFVLPTDRKLTVRIFHFQQKFFPVKSPLEDKLQRIHVSTFIP